MKRKFLIVCAALILGCAGFSFAQASGEEKSGIVFMIVQVERAGIREKPAVVSSIIASTGYGIVLKVFEIKEGWARVEIPGETRCGYVFATSLRKVSIPEGQTAAPLQGVTTPQIVLAGKGFISMDGIPAAGMVSYENSTQKLWLDYLESLTVDPLDALAFVLGGN